MDRSELVELLSPEGLRLLDSLPPYRSEKDVLGMVTSLRKQGHSPGLVAAVLTHQPGPSAAQVEFTVDLVLDGLRPPGTR